MKTNYTNVISIAALKLLAVAFAIFVVVFICAYAWAKTFEPHRLRQPLAPPEELAPPPPARTAWSPMAAATPIAEPVEKTSSEPVEKTSSALLPDLDYSRGGTNIEAGLFGIHPYHDDEGLPQEPVMVARNDKWSKLAREFIAKHRVLSDLEWSGNQAKLFATIGSSSRLGHPVQKAWVAATAYVESRGRADIIGDGGNSFGAWQIHKRYHGKEVAAMGSRWSTYQASLDAFLDVIAKQMAWNKAGNAEFHRISAYFNEGGSWDKPKGQAYADMVMHIAGLLAPTFRQSA